MIKYIRKISGGSTQALKTIGIYTFSSFFTKALSFASLPLFTFLLTPRDFGFISIFSASIGFVMPLVSLSILYSTSTDYFKLDKTRFASFISSTFFLPVVVSLFLGLVFFLFFPFFEETIGFASLFIWLLPLVAYCNFLFEQCLILLRNNNQSRFFLYITCGKILVELCLAILLISVFHYGWQGRIWGISLGFLLSAIFAIFYLLRRKYILKKISLDIVKKELVYSVPAILMQFSVFCINTSDRYFINYYYGEERTGVYSLSATFASVILIFCMALLQFFSPKIYSELSKKSSGKVIKNMFIKYCLIILGGYIGLIVFTTIFYHYFINKNFLDGLPYFFMLVTGNAIWCIGYFLYSFLLYNKEKRKIFFISIFTILLSILVNNFLIRRYAETGASVASIVNCSLVFILILFTTKGHFKNYERNSKESL